MFCHVVVLILFPPPVPVASIRLAVAVVFAVVKVLVPVAERIVLVPVVSASKRLDPAVFSIRFCPVFDLIVFPPNPAVAVIKLAPADVLADVSVFEPVVDDALRVFPPPVPVASSKLALAVLICWAVRVFVLLDVTVKYSLLNVVSTLVTLILSVPAVC